MGRGKDTGLRRKKPGFSFLFCDLEQVATSLTLGFLIYKTGVMIYAQSSSIIMDIKLLWKIQDICKWIVFHFLNKHRFLKCVQRIDIPFVLKGF